jgi:hypothetical protein
MTKLRERILFGASHARRLPFALRDLRESCFRARELGPDPFFEFLIKQTTKAIWPTVGELDELNQLLRARGLAEVTCSTRERVVPPQPIEPTAEERKRMACAELDAIAAARPLKPPSKRSEFVSVPSEVHKLRAKYHQRYRIRGAE